MYQSPPLLPNLQPSPPPAPDGSHICSAFIYQSNPSLDDFQFSLWDNGGSRRHPCGEPWCTTRVLTSCPSAGASPCGPTTQAGGRLLAAAVVDQEHDPQGNEQVSNDNAGHQPDAQVHAVITGCPGEQESQAMETGPALQLGSMGQGRGWCTEPVA